jgi:hypothetical protein
MELLIMKFSPASYHFIPLTITSNLLGTLFSNTLNVCSSANVSCQVSHSKEMSKTTVILF